MSKAATSSNNVAPSISPAEKRALSLKDKGNGAVKKGKECMCSTLKKVWSIFSES